MTNEMLVTCLMVLFGVFFGAAVIVLVTSVRADKRRHAALERLALEILEVLRVTGAPKYRDS